MMNKKNFSSNAINYAWRQLALRSGGEFSMIKNQPFVNGLPLFYGDPSAVVWDGKKIIVVPCNAQAWDTLLAQEPNSLIWASPEKIFPTHHLKYKKTVPILFCGDPSQGGSLVELREDGTLIFRVDIVAATFFMLSRWEETRSLTQADGHARFPASASVAYRQGFLDVPIVDLYATIFKEWLSVLAPTQTFEKNEFSVNLTHDIDWVRRFSGGLHFLRVIAAELIKKKSGLAALRQIRNLYIQITRPADDDFFRAIYDLAEWSEACGMKSRFYFMAAERSRFQQGYNPALAVLKNCMLALKDRGHEIGIHPGYSSFANVEKLTGEKEALQNAIHQPVLGGRQHYLRFRAPDTWRDWEAAGLKYDSTMGYADQEGFRCGTAYPYQPFDVEQDRALDILEIPLIVMDTTLKVYRNLTPAQAKARILELAKTCQTFGGQFTLLWHNTSLVDDWQEWGQVYREALFELAKLKETSS
ncbi:MAG: polysaccharide deacetylase family protein [Anaerolineales bacterium]|nr:polysaccharide deacetylase family protein [Anaerolineales bacterium]